MMSEVVNALFITFIATEYTLSSDGGRRSSHASSWYLSVKHVAALLVVVIVNVSDHVTGATDFANEIFQGVLHAPKIVVCADAYMSALYLDCKRVAPLLSFKRFVRYVGAAFCRVAPAYPILAVAISFVFMFVISLWEALHLPLEWLNMPIYYGTLYGPFSAIYYIVKKRVLQEYYSLPTISNDSEQSSMGVVGAESNPSVGAAMKRRQVSG